MPDDVWEIIAVRCGRMSSTKEALYHRFSTYGEPDAPQGMEYFFYVLLSPAGRVALVDCGFSIEEAGRRPGRETVVTVAEALARLRLSFDRFTANCRFSSVDSVDPTLRCPACR